MLSYPAPKCLFFAAAALTLLLAARPVPALPRRVAAVRRTPARPGSRPAAAPAAPKPAPSPAPLTAATLASTLKAAGYAIAPEGGYQRVRVEEESYGYFIDFSLSKSGDWLVCMAHLAPIPDLTKVPAAPLLSLLAQNDSLLGMYFSYDRTNAQVMLNATIPNRALNPAALKTLVEGMKATIRDTHGLWDPATW